MSTAILTNPETSSIIREGWQILVAQLGLQKATKFVILLERGKGDAVEEITRYWGDTGIEDIYHRVGDWKTSQAT